MCSKSVFCCCTFRGKKTCEGILGSFELQLHDKVCFQHLVAHSDIWDGRKRLEEEDWRLTNTREQGKLKYSTHKLYKYLTKNCTEQCLSEKRWPSTELWLCDKTLRSSCLPAVFTLFSQRPDDTAACSQENPHFPLFWTFSIKHRADLNCKLCFIQMAALKYNINHKSYLLCVSSLYFSCKIQVKHSAENKHRPGV